MEAVGWAVGQIGVKTDFSPITYYNAAQKMATIDKIYLIVYFRKTKTITRRGGI